MFFCFILIFFTGGKKAKDQELVVYLKHALLRRRELIGDYIAYRRLIVYYAVFEREGVVCEWL